MITTNDLFVQRLIKLRTDFKISQTDLAKSLNITRQAYNNYERGLRVPALELVTQLADFFKVSTDYLLGLTDNPSQKNEDTKKSLTNSEAALKLQDKFEKMGIDIEEENEFETLIDFVDKNKEILRKLMNKTKE